MMNWNEAPPPDETVSASDDLFHDTELSSFIALMGRLGEGPRGDAWLGLDEVSGDEVVVKRLNEVTGLDFERVNEALILLRTTLPKSVVAWRCAGMLREDAATGPALVRDYVPAENLASLIRSQSFTVRRALEVANLVAAQLVQLHAEGHLFLTLRPSNVVLTKNAQGETDLLLLDGLLIEPLYGLIHGPDASLNDSFKAPELREGAEPSATADVYALGMLLRAMLPSEDRLTAPIIERCTALRPSARYATMAKARDAIENALRRVDDNDANAVRRSQTSWFSWTSKVLPLAGVAAWVLS